LPIGTNPLRPQVVSSPLAMIFASDRNNMGNAETFPYVATTYSITELFRHWTMMLAILVHIYMAFWVKGSITGMIEGESAAAGLKSTIRAGTVRSKRSRTSRDNNRRRLVYSAVPGDVHRRPAPIGLPIIVYDCSSWHRGEVIAWRPKRFQKHGVQSDWPTARFASVYGPPVSRA
jgi:hypothetical protein